MFQEINPNQFKVFAKLEKAVRDGNVECFKKQSKLIEKVHSVHDFYNNNNYAEMPNLVILACKHNKEQVLKEILTNGILNNPQFSSILPEDEDESHHNAFYYAMRWGNIELLEMLIQKWPSEYFVTHSEQLDDILSKAYEELKLKNVTVSDKMRIFIENNLLSLRFFSNNIDQDVNLKTNLSNIKERIKLVIDNIRLLNEEYSNEGNIDERFLFVAKFIAQNIHVLKRQLKSTYKTIPWEEIEFCLICFISLHIKQHELNVFYRVVLNKKKILNYLANFAKILQEEETNIFKADFRKLSDLPKRKRDDIVSDILIKHPQFNDLYKDYQQIRDTYSLTKIQDYIKVALVADSAAREGQLIITRVLQVIGEYIKNTLESPKLSKATNELLIIALPKNTRKIIIDLRNSLTHAYSFSERSKIEENKDVQFFMGVQNDTKKIGNVISDILYNRKIKTIRKLLQIIINSENLSDIQTVSKVLNNVHLNESFFETSAFDEYEKMEKLVAELRPKITGANAFENNLFDQIDKIIDSVKNKSSNIRTNYITGFSLLKSLCNCDISVNINDTKFYAVKILNNITPKIESEFSVTDIAELAGKIVQSYKSRNGNTSLEDIGSIIYEIFYISEFKTCNIKWIEELGQQINEKYDNFEGNQHEILNKRKFHNQLKLKLNELKEILNNSKLNKHLAGNFPVYKDNHKLQAVIEMLVLDILSILGMTKCCLENNLLFSDENSPLLTGKCLRNHLAHDNVLIDVLLSDPSLSIVLNAQKLASEDIIESKRKIGKPLRDNLIKLKQIYDRGLNAICVQEKMFAAIEEGNLEDLKSCIQNGADVFGKSINSWSALHFAAKGDNLDMVKFIIDHKVPNDLKNLSKQNALHIAAEYGRTNIVEYFIKHTDIPIDDVSDFKKTPIHYAARNGHKDTVEILIKYKAQKKLKDKMGFLPFHYAITYNHLEVVEILLPKEDSIDSNDASGFTPLHLAAERGHLDLVNFFIEKGANVNRRNDKNASILHSVALKGYYKIAKTLILKGANVNVRDINGCTPLHFAIENGSREIVNLLLKNGANVNAVDNYFKNTPLHYAAEYKKKEIIDDLLSFKADPNACNINGITPLHLAVECENVEIIEAILRHNVNVNARDKNGATPLHHTADGGNVKVAEMLLKKGAEVNAKGIDDITSLHIFASRGNVDLVRLLLKYGANVNVGDNLNGTPLHAAAINGSPDVIDVLISAKANINALDEVNRTPLHNAAMKGNTDAVALLLKHNAKTDKKDLFGTIPIHAAIFGGSKDVIQLLIETSNQCREEISRNPLGLYLGVESGSPEIVSILLENGARVDERISGNPTPLAMAIMNNQKEIVRMLISFGADVNACKGEPIAQAVRGGYKDIFELLVKMKASIHHRYIEGTTLLHLAVASDQKEMINALIAKGADVNAPALTGTTPLQLAAQKGDKFIVKMLLSKGANINAKSLNGTALHYAVVEHGHKDIVELLLDSGADSSIKDSSNRTPLDCAAAKNQLECLKVLMMKNKKTDINDVSISNWTILHIAAQESNLQMVKYLVNQGSDINAKNSNGSKAIHIAASNGKKDILEYLINNGTSIDTDKDKRTLLHCAAMSGDVETLKYVLAENVEINGQNKGGLTALHIAANFDFKKAVVFLLEKGAFYDIVDKENRTPADVASCRKICDILESTEKLFKAVQRNDLPGVEYCIKKGAVVNAKHSSGTTSLHHASSKGFEKIVEILLTNKADPNVIIEGGTTPLHIAAKAGHFGIVQNLLINGAIFDIKNDEHNTPQELASSHQSIKNIFKQIFDAFNKVMHKNISLINDIQKIKDANTKKAIMNALNRKKKTLVVVGFESDFPKISELTETTPEDGNAHKFARLLCEQEDYSTALEILQVIQNKKIEMFGQNNAANWDVEEDIAQIFYKQRNFQKSLELYEKIYKQKESMLGKNHRETFLTATHIAINLHRQAKNDEALKIFNDILKKQKQQFGNSSLDVLNTRASMAMVYDKQKNYDEALKIYTEIYEVLKKTHGKNNPSTLANRNNLAMVLANQGKFEEALTIYEEVYEARKVVLGLHHSDTLRTKHNIVAVQSQLKKFDDALKGYQEVYEFQRSALGANHFDTLTTQCNMASCLFSQGKIISALKHFNDGLELRKAALGPNHPDILDTLQKIKLIHFWLKLEGNENLTTALQAIEKNMKTAASNGDEATIKYLINYGASIEEKGTDGRVPLHYAVHGGHVNIVKILLDYGAKVDQITVKGNTPLHTAASVGHVEITKLLLKNITRDKLNKLINVKTTGSGATALHVAAKKGCIDIVKSLLAHGASFDIEDTDGKTPTNLSKDQKVIDFLKLVEKMFSDVKDGDVDVMNKLKNLDSNDLQAVINARHKQGVALLQVAIMNKRKQIASELLAILKNANKA